MQRIPSYHFFESPSQPSVQAPALDAEISHQATHIATFAKFTTTTLDFDFDTAIKDPTTALQQLHHLGALLINSGKAYSALLMGDDLSSKPVTPDELATHHKLMGIYNHLPNIEDAMTVTQGHPQLFAQKVNKILHALLVIRIALDHLPADKIYKLYEAFINQNQITPLASTLTSFADGSGFVGSHAAEQVLHRYIYNNLLLFTFIPIAATQEILNKEGKYNALLCIGGMSRRELINSYMMVKLTALHKTTDDAASRNQIASRKG